MNLEEHCDYCPYRQLKLFDPANHRIFCTRYGKRAIPLTSHVKRLCDVSMPDLLMLLADPDRWILM